jgi:hypothetical protein
VRLAPSHKVGFCVVLADEDGNQAEVDVRVLVRNPLIWQRVYRGVTRARRRGVLELAQADARLWESLIRDVAEADRRALTSIDFWLPR